MTFVEEARAAAVNWKQTSAALPELARADAPCSIDGGFTTRAFPFCLPAAYADHNLLGEVRSSALGFFDAKAIPWHHGAAPGSPSNHLLDSQVQCVNALEPLATDPERLNVLLGEVIDAVEFLQVEDRRLVSFEWVGERDYLGEAIKGRPRVRGSRATSADAIVRYRTAGGGSEVALIEWKYTEDYLGKELSPDPRGIRRQRYRRWWGDPAGPLRTDVLPYDDLFVEPFYQLMRLQLLAFEMERAGELEASRVRVVYMAPARNAGLRASLNRESHRAAGDDVLAIWPGTLRRPDRFVHVDTARFLDAGMDPTEDFVARYGHLAQ